jgi:hypothetical protein
MSEWSVAITVGAPVSGLRDSDVTAVAEELTELAPVISVGAEAATIRVAVEGVAVDDALALALARVDCALEEVAWPRDVRHVEATEWSEFERSLEEPTYPDLVGITEIADFLGTSRQRASELARSQRFPSPLAELAAGPVWFKPTIAKFVAEWDRKPGRPRSKTTVTT